MDWVPIACWKKKSPGVMACVGLQAAPGVWPWVYGFVWLSSPTPGCFQSPVREDALPDLLPPSCFSAVTLAWAEAVAPRSPLSHVVHQVQMRDTSLQSQTAEQYIHYF